jgi:hypothetical protein
VRVMRLSVCHAVTPAPFQRVDSGIVPPFTGPGQRQQPGKPVLGAILVVYIKVE